MLAKLREILELSFVLLSRIGSRMDGSLFLVPVKLDTSNYQEHRRKRVLHKNMW